MSKEQYLTVEEITETLNLGTRSVMNLIRAGKLPAYQFGQEVRVRPDDFNDFVERSRIGEAVVSQ